MIYDSDTQSECDQCDTNSVLIGIRKKCVDHRVIYFCEEYAEQDGQIVC